MTIRKLTVVFDHATQLGPVVHISVEREGKALVTQKVSLPASADVPKSIGKLVEHTLREYADE